MSTDALRDALAELVARRDSTEPCNSAADFFRQGKRIDAAWEAARRALASPTEGADALDLLRAVYHELDEDGRDGPGHGHTIPGIWDRDNGEKAGKPCEWCATWKRVRAALAIQGAGEQQSEFERAVRLMNETGQGEHGLTVGQKVLVPGVVEDVYDSGRIGAPRPRVSVTISKWTTVVYDPKDVHPAGLPSAER